jgi:hypothetical protein
MFIPKKDVTSDNGMKMKARKDSLPIEPAFWIDVLATTRIITPDRILLLRMAPDRRVW